MEEFRYNWQCQQRWWYMDKKGACTKCITLPLSPSGVYDIIIVCRVNWMLMDHAHQPRWLVEVHYYDVIMRTMASRFTNWTTVYSTVYSRRRSKKTSKPRVTGLCEGNSPVIGDFPARRASNAANVPICCSHCVHSITIERVSISPFTYFSTGYFSDFKKLETVKHIRISLVIPQLSWVAFCPIRTWY